MKAGGGDPRSLSCLRKETLAARRSSHIFCLSCGSDVYGCVICESASLPSQIGLYLPTRSASSRFTASRLSLDVQCFRISISKSDLNA